MSLLDSPDKTGSQSPELKWLLVLGIYLLLTRVCYALLLPIAQSFLSANGDMEHISRLYEGFSILTGGAGLVISILIAINLKNATLKVIFVLLALFNASSVLFSLINLIRGTNTF